MAHANLLVVLDRMQQHHIEKMQLLNILAKHLVPNNNQNNHQHFSSLPNYKNISSQHRYNILTNIISPYPKLQHKDNYATILNHLPCGSKGENLNGVAEENNPSRSSKSLVSCDEDAQLQHYNPLSIGSKQVADQTPTAMEECLEQLDEIFDSLVAVEESQNVVDETNINILTAKLEKGINSFKISSEGAKSIVGNQMMCLNDFADTLPSEDRDDPGLQAKHRCSSNKEVSKSNYNDPFLQQSSKLENARFVLLKVESSLLDEKTGSYPLIPQIDCSLRVAHQKLKRLFVFAFYFFVWGQSKHKYRKRFKDVYTDVMVLDLKLYCFEEVYRYKKFGATLYHVQFLTNDASLRTSFKQSKEYDAICMNICPTHTWT